LATKLGLGLPACAVCTHPPPHHAPAAWPGPGLLQALLTRIPDELALMFGDRQWRRRMKPQTLSNLAMAYAHLRRRPQLLMTMLMKEALPLLPTFKPQELSTMLWAMATMEFFPGQSTVEAIARVRRWQQFRFQGSARAARGKGKVFSSSPSSTSPCLASVPLLKSQAHLQPAPPPHLTLLCRRRARQRIR
jgi:hypothetical protein